MAEQTDIFGGSHEFQPTMRRDPTALESLTLFTAPQTVRGQLAIPENEEDHDA